jgi:hypothetical protein
MKGLNLNYGQGNFSVLLDVVNSNIYAYNGKTSDTIIHPNFGGKQYYHSRSGASGAGWIPKKPGLFVLPCYRTDNKFDHIWLEKPVIGNWAIAVPIDYRQETLGQAPVLMFDSAYRALYLVPLNPDVICEVLARRCKSFKFESWEGLYFPRAGNPAEYKFPFSVYVHTDCKVSRSIKTRILANSSLSQLKFDATGTYRNSFFKALGFVISEDNEDLYKLRAGFCDSVVRWDCDGELSLEHIPESDLPNNVRVIFPDMYLQQVEDRWGVVHYVDLNNPKNCAKVEFWDEEWFQVLGGFKNYAELREELKRKLAQDLSYFAEMDKVIPDDDDEEYPEYVIDPTIENDEFSLFQKKLVGE